MEFTQEEWALIARALESYGQDRATTREEPVIEKLLTTIKGKNTDPEFKEP
jgi:hypothetical protein